MAAQPIEEPEGGVAEALELAPVPTFIVSALASGTDAVTYANASARQILKSSGSSTTWFPTEVSSLFDADTVRAFRNTADSTSSGNPLQAKLLDPAGGTTAMSLFLTHLPTGEALAQLTPITTVQDGVEALREEQQFRAALLELHALAHNAENDAAFFQTLLERAVEVVPGAQAGSVQVNVPETNRFRFVAAVGYDLEGLQRHDLEQQHMFRDATNPRARLVHDMGIGIRSQEIEEWLADVGRLEEIKVNVSAPVVDNGRGIAFLSLDNFDDPDAMSETSVEMTTVLGVVLGDLLKRRALEAELRNEREAYRLLALHDPLTGIANRRHLDHILKQRLSSARGRGAGTAVLFIDIDDFKSVNDRLGHEIGDELLVAVATGLNDSVRTGDIVGRWGGDEFLVLPVGVESADEALELADRILAHFGDELVLGDRVPFRARLTIGVGWSADSIVRAEQLIGEADNALYEAKSAGKGVARLRAFSAPPKAA